MEHNELEEMREQMALLNRKLDKEEIVSDEAISEVTRKNMDKLQKSALFGSIFVFVLIPLLIWDCNTIIGTIFWSVWGLATFSWSLILFLGLRKFKKQCNSIAESIETIKKTKRLCKIADGIRKFSLYSFLLFVIIAVIGRSVGSFNGLNEPDAIIRGMAGIAFFIITIAFIGSLIYVFHEIGKNDEPDSILDQILIELQEPNITETNGNETVADTETGK